MVKIDIFSWSEAFSDKTGKTSIPLIAGFMTITTGCLIGLISVFIKYGEGLAASSGIIIAGSTLLGIRRFTKEQPLQIKE